MARANLCRTLLALAAVSLVSAAGGGAVAGHDRILTDPADGASIYKISTVPGAPTQHDRRSARELGISVGVLPPGPLNAITDVAGVLVGQVTIIRGTSINTGVTAILAHGGNVFQQKVPAAIAVGNGFGKLVGFTQVQELGELESPIVLTCTLCVPRG